MRIYAFRRIGQRWGVGTGIRLPHVPLFLIVAILAALFDWHALVGLVTVVALVYVIRSLRKETP